MGFVLSLAALFVLQTGVEPAASWDDLAREYEQAFMHWGSALSRSGSWQDANRPPSPAVAFWPRFEALSLAGDGRATVWLLQNLESSPPGEKVLEALWARVRAAGTVPWVARALVAAAEHADELPRDGMESYLALQDAADGTPELRIASLLLRAALAADPAQREELRLHAAFLRWKGIELGPDERVEGELAEELATALVEAFKSSRWWQEYMFEGEDGIYYPHTLYDPDPRVTWARSLELLAERGSLDARLWVLTSRLPHTDEDKARFREHLDAIAKAPLTPEQRKSCLWYVNSWTEALGADIVEPRVRAIAAGAPNAEQAQLLSGLGEGLCASAADDHQRERGLAVLREVVANWPTTDAAKSAEGKLFRYTNLVVGKPCPDFETTDADGNAFKLSDYRGKVTVIDFWGFW